MAFPDFFADVPALRLHDGLAQLLGASDDGMIQGLPTPGQAVAPSTLCPQGKKE